MLKKCFVPIYAVLLLFFTFSPVNAESLVPYRCWQFHSQDVEHVSTSMKLASQYNINTVIFSMHLIWNTMDLFEDREPQLLPVDGKSRGQKLKELSEEAHSLGLRVWIWTHEFADVPEEFLINDVVQLDRPELWDWLEARYERVFREFPEFDGLLLTFREVQYPIFLDERVNSKLSKPDRYAKMINTIDKICSKYNKDFVVRTFVLDPEELQWVKEGLEKSSHRVMVQSKCTPHDWVPYWPHNPVIGAFPHNKHIIEFDCSAEFSGRNRIPYTSPEYFEYRWRYDLKRPGVVGYNARVDHAGFDALNTPNEINIYALYRLTEDAALTANDIWKEWTDLRYGRKAAPFIEKTLKPTFDAVNKSLFTLHFWVTSGDGLKSVKYIDDHLIFKSTALWFPGNPYYKELEQRLLHTDPEILEKVIAEKDSALVLAEKALLHLQSAKPYLTPGDYDDLYWRLELLHRTVIVWKYHAEALFGYKVLKEGYKVPGLRQRVERAINALYLQAEVSEINPKIGTLPPASANEIRTAADDLQKKLNALKLR